MTTLMLDVALERLQRIRPALQHLTADELHEVYKAAQELADLAWKELETR